jgi:hypothetical protein
MFHRRFLRPAPKPQTIEEAVEPADDLPIAVDAPLRALEASLIPFLSDDVAKNLAMRLAGEFNISAPKSDFERMYTTSMGFVAERLAAFDGDIIAESNQVLGKLIGGVYALSECESAEVYQQHYSRLLWLRKAQA